MMRRVFLVGSKKFYPQIGEIAQKLDPLMDVVLPNCWNDPNTEARKQLEGVEAHAAWKASMFRQSQAKVRSITDLLVVNFTKNDIAGYIGGGTFLEMYDALCVGAHIWVLNPISKAQPFFDEVYGMSPTFLNGSLDLFLNPEYRK